MTKAPITLLKVGIVGTGYAAQKRAEALKSDDRAELLIAAGNTPEKLQDFCRINDVDAADDWQKLVNAPDLDLIFICTVNHSCGAIALAAIEAGKHVVVEYPLSLEVDLAAKVIKLAETKRKLLHVEHIEIIGGLHLAIKEYLPQIGEVFHASYTTIAPQHPTRQSWKYHRQMFGFPFSAALSRVHRLTDLLGKVASVNCHYRDWGELNSDYFTACLCQAQLNFQSGVTANITYGKGDRFWQSDRTFEIYGSQGKIVFEGQKGILIREDKEEIPVASRRGLFAQDTAMVLDHLGDRQPLYLQPQASLYALQVANAAQKSASTGKVVYLN